MRISDWSSDVCSSDLVLFLDLDRFKDINDSLGHAAGDRILRSAAVRLQQTVGKHHTVARLSGDELTVVLENLESLADADKFAREIIRAFEAPMSIHESTKIQIAPSLGKQAKSRLGKAGGST